MFRVLWLANMVMMGCLTIGCAPSAPPTRLPVDPTQTAEDALAQLAETLRRSSTPEACRNALNLIDTQLSGKTDRPQLTDAQVAALAPMLNLNEEDQAEIRRAEFSGLDSQYLSESLLFRDAVNNLEIENDSLLEQSQAVFAWVMRQIWHEERIRPVVPPLFVARRGSGDGLERAYVFLAALQQLGLPAALIGPPGVEKTVSASPQIKGQQPTPFWAVGVRIGDEVYLFDPWQGVFVPNVKGDGPATLKQWQANPAASEKWLASASHIGSKDTAILKTATAYLVPPLSGLSPRLSLVEERCADTSGVRLVTDVVKLQQAFPGAVLWNPLNDPGTYTHALSRFLPSEDGGFAKGAAGERLFDAFRRDLVPWGMFPPALQNLQAEGAVELKAELAGQFVGFVLAPNGPHEKMFRGQYNEVVRTLSNLREDMVRTRERAEQETGLVDALNQWVTEASSVYADLSRARRKGDAAALAVAQKRVDDLRRQKSAKFQLYLSKIIAEQFLLEATYLIALSKHEQAERAQWRIDHGKKVNDADRATVRDIWQGTSDWWAQFLRQHERFEPLFPGRFEQARRLAKRADLNAKSPPS